jgi:outer membrane protein assembly factor BamE (lipoprotein component of BamABCDE complex)
MPRKGLGWTLLCLLALVVCCTSRRSVPELVPQLRAGMTTVEVRAVLGDPTISESTVKDEKRVEYWSYLISHRIFRRASTFECLTFVEDRLSEWVQDYGVGGHSGHKR